MFFYQDEMADQLILFQDWVFSAPPRPYPILDTAGVQGSVGTSTSIEGSVEQPGEQ